MWKFSMPEKKSKRDFYLCPFYRVIDAYSTAFFVWLWDCLTVWPVGFWCWLCRTLKISWEYISKRITAARILHASTRQSFLLMIQHSLFTNRKQTTQSACDLFHSTGCVCFSLLGVYRNCISYYSKSWRSTWLFDLKKLGIKK